MIKGADGMSKLSRGFTLVEMIVVIIVVGVLATLVVVSYSGISRNARIATLKSDLSNAVKQIQISYVENRSYPSVMPSDVQYSPGVGMSLSEVSTAKTYCLNGEIQNGDETLHAYYDSTVGTVQDGACSGNVIEGSQHGIAYNYVRDNSFTLINDFDGWFLSTEVGGDLFQTRAGTNSDPVPNKPVLILPNTSSVATDWGVIQGPVDWFGVTGGRDYKISMWVRKTGNFTGNINNIEVMDDTGMNASIYSAWNGPISDSWQYISNVEEASNTGSSGNLVYIWLDNLVFLNSGWTVEIQDPRIIEVK